MLKTRLTAIATLAAGLLATAAVQAEEEKILNIYNWSDYIAEDTVEVFEERTGIKVNYDVFDSNEVLEAKLLAGGTGYDLVVPTATFLDRQIQAGVFAKLDKSKLKNWSNLDPEIMKLVESYDPGNEHSIPYMWGTTGFGYNAQKVKERMPDAPVDSWDMLFKPEVVSRFADCGVSLLDAPTDVVESVLKYIGRDPRSQEKEDLEAAEKVLMAVRPYIKYFHSSQNINDLANGEICVAMGWSGDILIARDRANEAAEGGDEEGADESVEIVYTIPKEGAIIWFDMMAIPADAPHPENAHAFLDYLLEPEVIAAVSNYVFYANPNAPALEFVDDEVKGDPGIYPPPEVKANLFTGITNTPKYERLLTRAWTRIKTGQ